MKLTVANPTGLCFGVRRAIEQLETTLQGNQEVFSLGSPIHNPQEVERLEKKGLHVVETPEEVPEGAVAFIRAHGVCPETHRRLEARCRVVVDGTCPFVRNAQARARSLAEEGYPVLILGDRNHPEVQGILGYVNGTALVVSETEEPEGILQSLPKERIGVLSQTTQKVAALSDLVGRLVSWIPEVRVYNTICRATLARQESVCRLAATVDGILIIGGRNSANTRKLAEIARDAGAPTLWIEHAGELDRSWLEHKGSVGVAAGGSTPDWLIRELIETLEKL